MIDQLPYLDSQIEPLIGNHLSSLLKSIDLIEQVSNEMLQALCEDVSGHNMFLALSTRIYNHLLAGQLLFRKGLSTDAIICLRSAVESIYLFQFLIQDKDRMVNWLSGTEYSPMTVRENLPRPDLTRNIYGELSNISHPNIDAVKTYAEVDHENVGVTFGPRIFVPATQFTFIQLMSATVMFLRMITTLLKAAKPQGKFDQYDETLERSDKIIDELIAKLAYGASSERLSAHYSNINNNQKNK